jgi:hypothetical protein
LEEYADIASELTACVDSMNRVVEEIACPASQKLLKQHRYFLKQYDIDFKEVASHQSATCIVYLGIDRDSNNNKVCLKFMSSRE